MRMFALVFFVVFICSQAVGQDRTNIHIFKYATIGDRQSEVFQNFLMVFSEKMPLLAAELLNENLTHDLPMLSELKVATIDENWELTEPFSRIASLSDRSKYWRDVGALILLTGRVVSPTEQTYSIRSNFFIGDYEALLGTSSFAVELPVTARNYDTTNDSHSVAILVILALGVMSPNVYGSLPDCSMRSTSFELLNQADQRMRSVMLDNEELGERLEELVMAAGNGVSALCP